MQKIMRLLAIGIFAISTAAVATSPKLTASTINAEGGSPIPMCMPDDKECKPW